MGLGSHGGCHLTRIGNYRARGLVQEQHITSYLSHLSDLKAKGVDNVIFIASNDAFVMSAWGKANGIKDESIVRCFLLPITYSLAG